MFAPIGWGARRQRLHDQTGAVDVEGDARGRRANEIAGRRVSRLPQSPSGPILHPRELHGAEQPHHESANPPFRRSVERRDLVDEDAHQ
jgi:hypothetical protein